MVSTDGTSINDFYGGGVSVSADGRYIAYQSRIVTTAANDPSPSNPYNVVVRDMNSGTITLASVDTTGTGGGNQDCTFDPYTQAISADGRYVVFHSSASNLVSPPAGGTNSYLRDLWTGTTVLVSASAVNGSAVGSNGSEVISPDGRWVAFATGAANVVAEPTNDQTNVYVRDIQTGTLTLASVNMAGTGGGNAGSGLGTFYDFPGGLSFSANGRYLAFRSMATDLTSGVVTGNRNLYVRDLDAGQTLLVTPNLTNTDGGAGDADTVGQPCSAPTAATSRSRTPPETWSPEPAITGTRTSSSATRMPARPPSPRLAARSCPPPTRPWTAAASGQSRPTAATW